MNLVDCKKAKSQFFVRTSEKREKITEVFGEVEYVEAPGVTGEIGFLTETMTEEAFEQKAGSLGSILQRIRVV